MTIKRTIFLLTILLSLNGFSQTDPLRKHLYVEYYPDRKIKSVGHLINNTTKTGKWIYYKHDGTILANGKYKNGVKIGRWTYFDYSNVKYVLHWKKNNPQTEKTWVDAEGQFNISEEVMDHGHLDTYLNGRRKF